MTGRQILFQVHWFLGVTAGLVLLVMGVTGGLYSFQAEILHALNPQVMQVPAQDTSMLPMAELVQRIETAQPMEVSRVTLYMDSGRAGSVGLRAREGEGSQSQYFDPYTGTLLGTARGSEFFDVILRLHRFLALGETGQAITGASTLALIFFGLSGLYLRWPREAGKWRAWLALDWRRKGRSFQWDLHAVTGTWCLLLYLLFALTGLWWSYGWYGRGLEKLFGTPSAPLPELRVEDAAKPDMQALWLTTQQVSGGELSWVSFRFHAEPEKPVLVRYALQTGMPTGVYDTLWLKPGNGEVVRHSRYSEKPPGEKLLSSIYPLHTGEYFGLPGRVIWMVASLVMPLFFVTGWMLYLDRRRKKQMIRRSRAAVVTGGGDSQWLIGFASQSGYAEQLAWQTAGQLQEAGHAVEVAPLARLDAAKLKQTDQALFVVSTFGEGEPPDSARAFERKLLSSALALPSLRYAMLALGDRQYQQFCGFARRVNDWLSGNGAQALFAPVEVDQASPDALRLWQEQLATVTGTRPVRMEPTPFAHWRITRRELLNEGSQGEAVYLISLQSDAVTDWRAGDILVLWPGADEHTPGTPGPGETREYSIASVASDGRLDLIVRRTLKSDGSLGLGSGWLIGQPLANGGVGGGVRAIIRRNSGFHSPAEDVPMILIGNGTGMAGLRSLLKERIAQGRHRNWLMYGERNARCDFLCGEEVMAWLKARQLDRLDLAFSRDQANKHYVQDLIRAHAGEFRRWVEQGAVIYVCGSLEGMAGGVDETLKAVLGEATMMTLIETARYRRDVY